MYPTLLGIVLGALLLFAIFAFYMQVRADRRYDRLVRTCRHCGQIGIAGEDHTCTCHFSDEECLIHPANPRKFPD